MSPNWNRLSLWPNQRAALNVCRDYLEKPDRAALVQMPTGTGKTGVIAMLSRLESDYGAILVVSPSKGLAAQLKIDIEEAFWSKIKAASHWRPAQVRALLPSTSKESAELLENASGVGIVLVGTLVSLLDTARDYPTAYAAIQKHARLVIVDEGHREPADQWANAVRSLRKPTILFSATPYRNDLRQFDVSDQWIHFLSFRDAVKEYLIRDVEFENLTSNGTSTGFARAVIAGYDAHIASGRLRKNSRVIVRCGSQHTVRSVFRALASELKGRPETCLALHEEFAGEAPPLFANVPNIRERGEIFLVHQYKLTEGIDDPRCMMLALFEQFENERQLVQQIGRILRHPNPRSGGTASALVIAENVRNIKAKWDGYRLFDRVCHEAGGRPPIRNSVDTLKKMLEAFPEVDYQGGKFRKVADFAGDDIAREVRVPKSCLLYRLGTRKPAQSVDAIVRQLLLDQDRTIVNSAVFHEDRCFVYLAIVAAESPFLSRSLFPTLGLEVTLVVKSSSYLFFYDSGGLSVDEVLDATRLKIDEIKGLMPDSPNLKLTSMSLLNGDIGPSAMRSRTIGAASLADAVPFMGDNAYFISRTTGRLADGNRRYLGITRARVRDNDGEYVSLDDFVAWGDSLVQALETDSTPAAFFERFAAPVAVPKDPTPSNILLEVSTIEHSFVDQEGKTLEIEDACAEVETDNSCSDSAFKHAFVICINGEPHKAWLRWDPERAKYIVLSAQLDAYHEIGKSKVTLTARLNQAQDFRIILTSTRVFYAAGQFYDFLIRFNKGSTASLLLDLLTEVPKLIGISSEKGERPKGTQHPDWDPDSLFHFIDKGMSSAAPAFGARFSHVVCDDMGTEAGDFIGIGENQTRVVFVQAKCKRDASQVAASALYDVCAQANKNLTYLRYGGGEMPNRVRKWSKPWKGGSKDDTYEVRPRIRSGPGAPAIFYANLNAVLAKPGVRREMWLILGKTLSKSALKRDLQARKPPANAIQTFYLLMSAHNACKSVGVELSVFCSP
jgi:hypothetical protein